MRFYLLLSIVLNAVLATAQPNLFQNQVSGSVGITGGQTARLNVVYPFHSLNRFAAGLLGHTHHQ